MLEPSVGPPASGELFQTPASLACAYGLVPATNGCNPNLVKTNPSGGSKAIAIVDAYDSTGAATDLAAFNQQFGLPNGFFTKIYGTGDPALGCKNGPQPSSASGTGWDLEAALDIEYAHAMAPHAHLYLVEAASNSSADLFNAEQVATRCVIFNGGGQVSNSFGGQEYSDERTNDKYFRGNGVVYFASTGDNTYQSYPATSPFVVAVGGTTISSNPNTGAYQWEQSWYPNPDYYYYDGDLVGEGAGSSGFEPRPSYQDGVSAIVGSRRGTPDIVADADPASGAWVYNASYCGGWCTVGGTSLSAPLMAGITNGIGNFYASSTDYLTRLYALGTSGSLSTYFRKMDSGNCGAPTDPSLSGAFYAKYPTAGGGISSQYQEAVGGVYYNECGGWGSPVSNKKLSAAP